MNKIPVTTLDARGALCPIPTVKTALLLEDMRGGGILELLTDDPVTKTELPAWCEQQGHRVRALETLENYFKITVQKKHGL